MTQMENILRIQLMWYKNICNMYSNLVHRKSGWEYLVVSNPNLNSQIDSLFFC